MDTVPARVLPSIIPRAVYVPDKERKNAAVRKLEATEQNLVRINDLTQEIRRQLGSLQRQARKAERYHDLARQLEAAELRLLVRQHDAVQERLRTAAERVNGRLKIFWGADDGNVTGAPRFHAHVAVVLLVHIALATLLATAPRQRGVLGQTRLNAVAEALRRKLGMTPT